jgi:hypothetical protein
MANPETVTPMTQVGAFGRDDNDSAITTLGLQQEKTITYAALTTGATGTTTLFTVTGTVAVKVFGFCTTNLAGSGTIEVGVAGSTAALCDQVAATDVDNHDVYQGSVLAIAGSLADWKIINQNIIQTIATDTISGGVLTFYCEYVPLSEGAHVVAT